MKSFNRIPFQKLFNPAENTICWMDVAPFGNLWLV